MPTPVIIRTQIIRTQIIRTLIICTLGISMSGIGSNAARAESAAPSEVDTVALALLNEVRAEHHLPVLFSNPALVYNARIWASSMMASGHVSHDPLMASDPRPEWQKLGENVGRSDSVLSVEQAFEASPDHRANLMDPEFDSVGIAVVRDPAGVVWVVQRFQQTIPTAAPGAAKPTDSSAPSHLARRTRPRHPARL